MKDKKFSDLTEDNDKLKNETAGLRQRVIEVENEVNGKNSAIYACNEQIKFYKQRCSNAENDRKEKEKLTEKLKLLKKYVYYNIYFRDVHAIFKFLFNLVIKCLIL